MDGKRVRIRQKYKINKKNQILYKIILFAGEGIGKNSDGIIKPIKANLKFDNAGLCYDRAQEFTNHWWQKAFNDAANNLNISNSSENVSLSTKDESIEVSILYNFRHSNYYNVNFPFFAANRFQRLVSQRKN